jgi:hypothetical protein
VPLASQRRRSYQDQVSDLDQLAGLTVPGKSRQESHLLWVSPLQYPMGEHEPLSHKVDADWGDRT